MYIVKLTCISLSVYTSLVIATDISATQIAHTISGPGRC